MNTPAHLLFGAAAFADPDRRNTTTAALVGALAPDLSLYLMVGVSLVILQIPPQVVFDQLYFSDAWQQVFSIDNSFFVWGAGFAFGVWLKRAWLIAFCGAALLHLITDFALHHDDARMHFWPVSDWRFESPFSYWDRRHGAGWISPMEGLLSIGMFVLLWRRFRDWRPRAMFTFIVTLEVWAMLPGFFGMF